LKEKIAKLMDGRLGMIESLDKSVNFYISYRQIFQGFENQHISSLSSVLPNKILFTNTYPRLTNIIHR